MSKIVGRTLDFLELFAEQKRALSLSDIARLLEIPASSCHDVLQALQERGYIYEIAPRAGYYPTRRIYEIAKTIAEFDPVVLRADTLLRALRDTLGESVLLAKVSGLQGTYLLAFESTHPLRFQASAGDKVRSLHATSAGKALLGSLSPAEFEAALRTTPLTQITPRTLTTKAALRRAVAEGNERGWFINDEESLEGVITISARFVWTSTNYIVTIAGPSSRMTAKLDQAVALLTGVCRRLEQPTGLEPDPPPKPGRS